ncbi:MAG: choice-of-anchor D domain-containing protein [Rhodothermales bacterium]|nr:choice-of-anchor D domain-containing protein [Rhodothermales bacterium]
MRVILLCLLLLLLLGSTGVLAQAPDVSVQPMGFDYGPVTVGGIRDRAFALTNEDSTTALIVFATEIHGPDADQFELLSGGGGFILEPGAVQLLSVRFAPTALGPKSAVLRIESDDPDENPLDVPLAGVGRGFPDLGVSQTTLSFGDVAVGATSILEVLLFNQGLADLEVTAAEVAGDDAGLFGLVAPALPLTLAPQEQDTLRIRFSPASNGGKSARLRLFSNDPDENPREILLFGQGASADIAVDSTGYDFGEVAVGSSAAFTFSISNVGTADLVVDSLAVEGAGADQFQVTGGAPPFGLGPGEAQPLTVQFVPGAEGPQSAVLALFSNDPDEPRLDLALRAVTLAPRLALSALQIDFGGLLAGLDTTRALLLINTGQANLTIFDQRITGGDSTQFAFDGRPAPFSLAPTDSILLPVRFAPTTAGAKQSTLQIASNSLTQPVLGIPLAGQASTIRAETGGVARLGEDVTVTFTLPAGFRPSTREVRYRSAGETSFRTAEVSGAGPEYRATIPGIAVRLGGVEYFVRVTAGSGVVTLPVTAPESQPLFLPAFVSRVEAPLPLPARDHRMISVPLVLDQAAVDAVLTDDYGPYNTRRWRLFRWEGDDYAEYPALASSFAAGNGFWLITSDGAPFDVENGRSADPSMPFRLTLQPGWNQIGNPYAFPVAWPAASLDPRIEAPVAYDSLGFQYGQTLLNPWEGYFVHNLAPTPLTVALSPGASGGKQGAPGGGASYRLRLFADVAGEPLRDTQTYLGFAEQAHAGQDALDFTKAPPLGPYVRVAVVDEGTRYAGNFKPMPEGGAHWDLEVDGTSPAKSVRIRLAGQGRLPEGYGLYVLDRDRRQALALTDSTIAVDLPPEAGAVRRLRILVSTPQYADAHRDGIPLTPAAFHLAPNFPNPFRDVTTIRYQVSAPGPVRIEIYNLVGQRVRTLVDAAHEPGSYTAFWDGRTEGGVPAASGLYLYRLRAGAFTATQKMLLIR